MKSVIDKIFKYTKGFYTHVVYNSSIENLTRFGDNEISQNISRKDCLIEVRICDDKRAVKFTLSKFDDESIKKSVELGKEKIKHSKPLEFVPYPTKTNVKIDSKKYFDKNVTEITPIDRANRISKIISLCKKTSRLSYGIISDSTSEIIVTDDNGLFQRAYLTSVSYEITINKGGGYGKACGYSWKDDLDYESINEKALKKADASQKTIEIKPGKYSVIIEPLACSEVLGFVGYLGFNGLAYYEKRSFLSDRLGEKILSDKLTIVEDPLNFPIAVLPFDLEGYPRERVLLVDKGVVKNVVTDKKTSKLTGLRYSGHSLLEPNGWGAFPVAMSVEAGNKTLDEIISETDYAILVTEFHYVNPIKAKTLELTGMTRNGTFLVKDGKISSAIKNMRFTQSFVEALSNIEDISSERYAYEWWSGGILTPAIKINNFNFSSSTEF